MNLSICSSKCPFSPPLCLGNICLSRLLNWIFPYLGRCLRTDDSIVFRANRLTAVVATKQDWREWNWCQDWQQDQRDRLTYHICNDTTFINFVVFSFSRSSLKSTLLPSLNLQYFLVVFRKLCTIQS